MKKFGNVSYEFNNIVVIFDFIDSSTKEVVDQQKNNNIDRTCEAMKNFVEELKWRGMLAQIMPGTEEYLQTHLVSAYLGTDPTADSLHIGHLCGIMMLRHLQSCGHKPYLLVGGATGMIGDPSGKSLERNLLDSAKPG